MLIEYSTQQTENTQVFFLVAHGAFIKSHHIIGHKSNLKNTEELEIMSSILSDHSLIKLEINSKRNYRNIQAHGN